MSLQERCAIAVMAKAPRPGRVKTRLAPVLTPEQAVQLSAAFLRDITDNLALAARSVPIDGWIAYAPAGDAALFDGLLAPGTRLLLADGAIDAPHGVEGFGRCLLQTIEALLSRGYGAACVLNADSPTLPTAILVRLADTLLRSGEGAVLGPAEDGGYYVLGMRRSCPALFADIAWSTERVADQTRAQAEQAGLELVELPAWYDVDDPASLARLQGAVAGAPQAGGPAPYPAPVTAACLRRLGLARVPDACAT